MEKEIKICGYQPQYKSYFESYNKAWLKKHFKIEAIDERVLTHPEKYVLAGGGEILFAVEEGNLKPLGVVALMKTDGVLELTKMAVEESQRGKGIGKMLMDAALIKAREMGFKKVELYTNTLLQPAFKLYRSYGFSEIPFDAPIYKRCNCRMEKYLETDFSVEEMGILLGDYKNAIESLKSQIKEIPDAAMDHRPLNDGWTIAQQLKHLIDAESVAYVRLRKFIAEPGSDFVHWDSEEWIDKCATENQSLDQAFEMYKLLRLSNHWLLRSLTVKQFYDCRLSYKEGKIALIDWLLTFKNHNHFGQIKRNLLEYKSQTS